MNIESLCEAVNNSMYLMKTARTGRVINHSAVEAFQESIKNNLNAMPNGYVWEIEKTAKGRSEKDSIDILGKAKGSPDWIIEIDATRSDQVSQKMLSRMALWGLQSPIQYVAILYPDTQNGKNACEKYLRYGNAILKKINNKSSVTGIFVDPSSEDVEVLQFNSSDHFYVNGVECKSMTEAAARAIKEYAGKYPQTYSQLKAYWGKYVLNDRGPSRYKNIGIKTTDGVTIWTYTQFRQYGLSSYWTDFERLCKKKGIKVTKMRKVYIGLSSSTPFKYIYES